MLDSLRKNAPVWLSLLAGAALWEIVVATSNPAFLVPLSETLVRLWQLREHAVNSLFADQHRPRHRGRHAARPARPACAVIHVGVDPYIMTLYATPIVVPILSLMACASAPRCWWCSCSRCFPCSTTRSRARHVKPERIEVARSYRSSEQALWAGNILPYTMTGVRQAIRARPGRHRSGSS